MRKVRAAVITKPGEIKIQEFPYPSVKESDMLVKMEMSGICGTDKHTYKGELRQYAGTAAEEDIPLPIIPGHEDVGVVAEIGKQAKKNLEFYGRELKEGDRVVICPDIICGRCWYCRHIAAYPWCENIKTYGVTISCKTPPHLFGGWAEYMYVTSDTFVFKVPPEIPPRIAVLTEPLVVTYLFDKAKEFYSLGGEGFGTGDTVLIQGTGPLGLCHIIKARIMGAGQIIAIDKSEYRLKLAKDFGADVTINVEKTTEKERIEKVKALTDARGVDLVVECVGIPEVVREGIEMLRKGGMYFEVGNYVETGTVSLSPHRHMLAKSIRLIGMTNHPYTGYGPTLKLIERYLHTIPFERIVTHQYKIEDAEDAILKSMQAESMKVVIVP
ncbi:zinc-binding dehydrogenase [Patescibacteria group bacterium]|nr:zinc-binding dehydrogenase [Patescibacteria group bacterium]